MNIKDYKNKNTIFGYVTFLCALLAFIALFLNVVKAKTVIGTIGASLGDCSSVSGGGLALAFAIIGFIAVAMLVASFVLDFVNEEKFGKFTKWAWIPALVAILSAVLSFIGAIVVSATVKWNIAFGPFMLFITMAAAGVLTLLVKIDYVKAALAKKDAPKAEPAKEEDKETK